MNDESFREVWGRKKEKKERKERKQHALWGGGIGQWQSLQPVKGSQRRLMETQAEKAWLVVRDNQGGKIICDEGRGRGRGRAFRLLCTYLRYAGKGEEGRKTKRADKHRNER